MIIAHFRARLCRVVLSPTRRQTCASGLSPEALVAVASVPDSPTLLGALEQWAVGAATVARSVVLGCSAVFA